MAFSAAAKLQAPAVNVAFTKTFSV